jgi:hypothetical protein
MPCVRILIGSILALSLAACGAPMGTGDYEVPLADPGDDRILGVGHATTLDGVRSCDPSGGTLVYAWKLLERPDASALAISSAAAVKTQVPVTVDAAGTYLVELVVQQGGRTSAVELVKLEATTDRTRWTTSVVATVDRCGNAL